MSFDPNAPASPDSGIFGLEPDLSRARVILIPVPFEATTSYGGGTSHGPQTILTASRQVDLFDVQVGRPYEHGIALLPEDPQLLLWNQEAKGLAQEVIAAGGAHPDAEALLHATQQVNTYSTRVNAWVEQEALRWLESRRVVGVIGGDHSTPFGAIAAHVQHYPELGILHFDAHADLRNAYEGFTWSHASIMHNVMTRLPQVQKLVQVGIRDLCEEELDFIEESEGRIVTFFDALVQARKHEGTAFRQLAEEIVDHLPRDVYVSFDIDGLDPFYCPHTGTPVPGGLHFTEAVTIFDTLVASGRRIVGFDINEVAPGPDGDEWDGNVAARLLYKLIGYTLLSRGIGRRPRIAWPAPPTQEV